MTVIAGGVLALAGCKKNYSVQPIVSSTPLQALINSDTSLSNYYAAVKKSNNNALYGSLDSITVLIPTNDAFGAAGITPAAINNLTAAGADSLLRYYFIEDSIALVPGQYSAFKSKLGPPLYGYGDIDSSGNYFNGVRAAYLKVAGSNATVYKLQRALQVPASSVSALLAADSTLSFYAAAVTYTGISLQPTGTWNTLLAPTNNAFRAAGFMDTTAIRSTDMASLKNILQYHILPSQFFSNSFDSLSTVNTVQGSSIAVSFSNRQVQFTGTGNTAAASIVSGNRLAGNNIIVHAIDVLLTP